MTTNPRSPFRRVATVLLWGVAGAIIGGAASFAFAQLRPRYVSSVLYQAIPVADADAPGVDAAIGRGGAEEIDRFIHTQMGIVRSDPVLRRVLEDHSVQETKWAAGLPGGTQPVSDAAVASLRGLIRLSPVPDSNLLKLSVFARDPEDASAIATVVDDAYRNHELGVSTWSARSAISDLERRIRERRQDVDALDIRIENIITEMKLTGPSIEQAAPFLERSLLISKLADNRVQLAALPASSDDETQASLIAAQRASLERVESQLAERIDELNKRLSDITRFNAELENLRTGRAQRMDRIRAMSARIDWLSGQLDRGSRIRVVSNTRISDTPMPAELWTPILIGAGVLAGLGLIVEGLRG